MKIAIHGLGAVGGLLAARLTRAGHSVSAVARNAAFDVVCRDGLQLIEAERGEERHTHTRIDVVRDAAELGPQDLLIVALKTTGLRDAAPQIRAMVGPDTTVLSAMNGIPWWFCHGLGPEAASIRLTTVDPGGVISDAIPPSRVVGCVVHLSAATPAPGVVRHVAGNRLVIGEPTGGPASQRMRAIVGCLREAAFEVDQTDAIQREIWFKLWGNMTMNPISAITGATGDRILGDDLVRSFMSRCMMEMAKIGERIGLPIDADPEARHAVTAKLGAFRTSMLQDVKARKPLELDALVSVLAEIAQQVGVGTPNIDALLGISRLYARTQGLYQS